MILTLIVFFGSIVGLVGLHEAGHFFVAKLSGVLVKEFAIGFGPRLLTFRGKETHYTLRAIPLGGFVRMAGEDRRETDEQIPSDRILYNKPPGVRAMISLAGPLANLLGAFVVILLVLWGFGLPMLQVADVIPGSAAAQHLLPGDRVRSIDAAPVYRLEDITGAIQRSGGAPVAVELVRGSELMRIEITPRFEEEEGRYVLGAYFLTNTYTREIVALAPAAPLRLAGLHVGDQIIAIDGDDVDTALDLLTHFDDLDQEAAGTLTVERGEEIRELELAATRTTIGNLFAGVTFGELGEVNQRPGLFLGLRLAGEEFAGNVALLATWARQLLFGEVAAGDAIAGPIGLAEVLGQGVRMGGAVFFGLLAFLSINFGLLNLIPFPALDGSRVAFALYESLRHKPIPPEREGLIHAVGFLILLGVMLLVTYQDIARLLR